jgi:hypothetical protein
VNVARTFLTLPLLWLLACVDEGETLDVPALDADRYALEVQPYVGESCGTLDCHGDPGRPLRIYSELGLRRGDGLRPSPVDADRDPDPITEGELQDNVLAFGALQPALSPGDERLVLSKPLSGAAGGSHHVGGDLWDGPEHPGYRCLRRWLDGEDGDAESCQEALDLLR